MLCIWRGAADWPEGPPSSGDSSSIQPARGLHNCLQPDHGARRPRRAWPRSAAGNLPGHLGGAQGPAPSVSVEVQASQAPLGGDVGQAGAWGRGEVLRVVAEEA